MLWRHTHTILTNVCSSYRVGEPLIESFLFLSDPQRLRGAGWINQRRLSSSSDSSEVFSDLRHIWHFFNNLFKDDSVQWVSQGTHCTELADQNKSWSETQFNTLLSDRLYILSKMNTLILLLKRLKHETDFLEPYYIHVAKIKCTLHKSSCSFVIFALVEKRDLYYMFNIWYAYFHLPYEHNLIPYGVTLSAVYACISLSLRFAIMLTFGDPFAFAILVLFLLNITAALITDGSHM